MFRRSHTVVPHTAIANPALSQTKGIHVVSESSVQPPGTFDTVLSNPLVLPIQICPTPGTPVTMVSFPSPSPNLLQLVTSNNPPACALRLYPQHEQTARSSFVSLHRVLPLVLHWLILQSVL